MTLTLRADCPACEGSFRVPLIAELTAGNRATLSFNPWVMKDLFNIHCAETPEKHMGVSREAAQADAAT